MKQKLLCLLAAILFIASPLRAQLQIASNSGGSPTTFKGEVYFAAYDSLDTTYPYHTQLWKISGTTPVLLKRFNDDFAPATYNFLVAGEYLYFIHLQNADGIGDVQLWRTDGTSAGTILVDVIDNGYNKNRLFASDKGLFFTVEVKPEASSYYINSIYWTDGSGNEPSLLKRFESLGGDLQYFATVGKSLYFVYHSYVPEEPQYWQLWRTDGTVAGTVLVKQSDTPIQMSEHPGNPIYFIVNSNQLWKSDGTLAGTSLVKTFDSTVGQLFVSSGNSTYLHVPNAKTGLSELWKSDGTPGGTVPLNTGLVGVGQLHALKQ